MPDGCSYYLESMKNWRSDSLGFPVCRLRKFLGLKMGTNRWHHLSISHRTRFVEIFLINCTGFSKRQYSSFHLLFDYILTSFDLWVYWWIRSTCSCLTTDRFIPLMSFWPQTGSLYLLLFDYKLNHSTCGALTTDVLIPLVVVWL